MHTAAALKCACILMKLLILATNRPQLPGEYALTRIQHILFDLIVDAWIARSHTSKY